MNPFEGTTNQRAREERIEFPGLHSETLHDQNEDHAGEPVNLADGKKFVNDGDSIQEVKRTLYAVEPGTTDALPDLREKNDAAAQWLRENGG